MNIDRKDKLRILIYGEPYEWAMAHNLRKSFLHLGCEVNIFDWTKWLYRTKKYTLKNRALDRIMFRKVARKINDSFMKILQESKFDLVIILKGIHLLPSTILIAKKTVRYVVNWNPDDFFNPLNNSKYLLDSFDKHDCIFTPRKHLVEEYCQRGASRVECLDWYYLPDVLQPPDISQEDMSNFGSELVFIGTWSRYRERMLSALDGFNLRIWGNHWNKTSKKFRRKFDCNNPVYGSHMCKVIACAKINLNFLTWENRDTTNIRNFEIPACAGFQLSERSDKILELFQEDIEIACFSGKDEMVDKCKYYLTHEDERNNIRKNGHKRLINGNHTIDDRALEILNSLSL